MHGTGRCPCVSTQASGLQGGENIDGLVIGLSGSVASSEEERPCFAPPDYGQRVLWLDCWARKEVSERQNDVIRFQA